MNKRLLVSIGTAALAFPSAVVAQDDTGPAQSTPFFEVSVSGEIQLESLHGDATDDQFLIGDVWAEVEGASGLGFDVGIEAVTDFDQSDHAIYAALTYSFGRSKLSVGIPAPAYDSFSAFPDVGGMRVLDYDLAFLNGGVTRLGYLFSDGDAPLGVRYDGDYDQFKVAASAHRFQDADADTYSFAAAYDVNSNFRVLGDWERVLPDAGGGLTTTRVGAEIRLGRWEGGMAYFNRDLSFAPHIDGTEAWSTFRPTSRIEITGTALNTNVADIYGISMSYEIGGGFAAQIGVADSDSIPTTYGLGLNYTLPF